jgi:hypothetical protein
MSEALLAVLILLPAVITFLLRSNAALAFLAMCGGYAAASLSGSNIQHLVDQTKITSLTSNNVELSLLALPLLLTLLFSFRSAGTTAARVIALIPALCAGGLLAAIAAPTFSDIVSTNIIDTAAWKELKNIQSFIIGAGLLSSLLIVWAGGLSHGHTHGKKHK